MQHFEPHVTINISHRFLGVTKNLGIYILRIISINVKSHISKILDRTFLVPYIILGDACQDKPPNKSHQYTPIICFFVTHSKIDKNTKYVGQQTFFL